MKTTPTTGIALDTIHPKKDGTLPLKLRVTHDRYSRYFGIKITMPDFSEVDSLTAEELVAAMNPKTRNIHSTQIGAGLYKELERANDIIRLLNGGFTFEAFKNLFTGKKKTADQGNIFFRYRETIEELKKENRFGTAETYISSMLNLKKFAGTDKLQYKDVTTKWLEKFTEYLTKDEITLLPDGEVHIRPGRSSTTVGIYLRPLRAIFNAAIDAKEIDNSVYPFRRTTSQKSKFKIPKGSRVKKALSWDELKSLFNADATGDQAKARDFFFFSYTACGMNVKDICLLKNEDVNITSLKFFRAKTIHTSHEPQEIHVPLTGLAQSIIEKYRTKDTNPKAYLFEIFNLNDSDLTKHKKVKAFTSFVNENIKSLALTVGISGDISTYYARHSFATQAIRGNNSIEYVSEALGHSDIKTTRSYFAGFEDKTKKDIQESLVNFNDEN